MRSRISTALDLALVGAVGAHIGLAGAFLASLTPPDHSPAVSTRASAFRGAGWGEAAGDSFSAPQEPDQTMHTPLRVLIDARFLAALAAVESGGDDAAYNPECGGTGRYQITERCLADANRILCTDYTLAEMHDPDKAARIVRAYLGHYGSRLSAPTPTALARIWNGGPNGYKRDATRGYAERFHRAYMEARRHA